ncbi:hypothetical protein SAMN05421736_106124 [Evansella caseinilytica]|uniref:Uncharacterized protein n=1 Tax=Evansella caseinilytica TaxID=1503961 RepID=A0A1H3QE86_9BACI|nr:hypothetical protein [Evansella caseinilytica]SDZ11325.1 hypothetical protein SAMN05421736_106124 [Evansella caseinilytica]
MSSDEEERHNFDNVKKDTYRRSVLGCLLSILLVFLIPIAFIVVVFISSINQEQFITESASPNNLEKITVIQKGGGFLHRGSTLILESSGNSIKVPIHEGASLLDYEVQVSWKSDEEAVISILQEYEVSFKKSRNGFEKSFKVVKN